MSGPGGAQRAGARYDYLLVVGPGRSGSTFLYRLLNAHPAFAATQIKEGHYYRSARRFERARRRLPGPDAILLDVANTAWADPRLAAVAALRRRGWRILVVVLLRRHRERAVSVMAYRESRMVFPGARRLERAALRDSLTVAALARIHALGVDVLAIGFDTLVGDPRAVLDALARLCGTRGFAPPDTRPVNPAVRARHPALGAAAKLAATVLRAVGARRLLQALKDEPRVGRLFFRPAPAAPRFALSAPAARLLDRRFEACLAAVAAASTPLGEGLWFAPGGRAATGGAPLARGRYKRAFDLGAVAAAALALLPLWPVLWLAVALAIRLDSPGPVLYRQRRLGLGGREFNVIKFRTMVDGAERCTGPVRAAAGDARTTRVGRVLRRWHVDELPQVVNVLRGEMSLVGPRPERRALAERIEREVPGFSQRLRVRPGIMGLAQALGPYHLHPRRKLRCDNFYIARMSPWLDAKLCLLCVRRVLRSVRGGGPARRRARTAPARAAKRDARRAKDRETGRWNAG